MIDKHFGKVCILIFACVVLWSLPDRRPLRPVDLIPYGIDVEREYSKYRSRQIVYVYDLPIFGRKHDLYITDPGRGADYGFIELDDNVRLWFDTSWHYAVGNKPRVTVASYKDGTAFVILKTRANGLKKRPYIADEKP